MDLSTLTPKVSNIKPFWAVCKGVGQLFYILFGVQVQLFFQVGWGLSGRAWCHHSSAYSNDDRI